MYYSSTVSFSLLVAGFGNCLYIYIFESITDVPKVIVCFNHHYGKQLLDPNLG